VHKLPPGPSDQPPVAKTVMMEPNVLEDDDDMMDIEYYNSDEWDGDDEYDEKGDVDFDEKEEL
jgi:hypothetical protein